LIDRITLIDEITTIGSIDSLTLLARITQLDKIHPDAASEGVTNGTFETNDFTGWTQAQATTTDQFAHGGTYSAFMYECWLRQDFATPIPKSAISSAKFWANNVNAYQPKSHSYDIGYSDGTEDTIVFITTSASNEFEEFDILSNIADDKSVSYINFHGDSGNAYCLDDVSIIAELVQTVINRVDEIVSMPAVTGTVEVTGSEDEPLLQRASTFDLIVQLRSAGVEIDPRAIRALTAADIVTVLCANLDVALSTRFKPTDSIGNTTFGATQATRTSLKVQPEREDIVSLGGVASPSAAGVQLVAPNGTKVPKVYDAEYEGFADGLHYFYFGTTTSPTTKRFLSRGTAGVNSKTFNSSAPRVGAAGDGIYLYASVSETNMPYDLGYTLE
jgi:hypothetical protein